MTTWRCPNCGYTQDFRPTKKAMELHFPECPGVKANECPSCREGRLKKDRHE